MNTQNHELKGRKIAILATDGFEQSELVEPKQNLENEGAKVEILSIHEGKIKGWNKTEWGSAVKVDHLVNDVNPEQYDALVLPGGVMNPDHLRMNKPAVAFVRQFAQSGKPVAAICHGPATLIEAGVVKGHTMTSWPSVHTDLMNAGANLGRPRGRHRRQFHHQPQAGRHPRLLPRHHADHRATRSTDGPGQLAPHPEYPRLQAFAGGDRSRPACRPLTPKRKARTHARAKVIRWNPSRTMQPEPSHA